MGSFFDIIYEPPVELGESYPLFTRVSLETTSQCTRKCSFCPVHLREPKVQMMTDDLFKKIILQLEDLGPFAGVIQWFYVNEPLYDRQIIKRLQYAREKLPKVSIHLTTNGDLLGKTKYLGRTSEKSTDETDITIDLRALFAAGVNSLNVNAYDDAAYERFKFLEAHVDGDHCWKRLSPNAQYLSFSDMRNPTGLHTWNDTVDIDEDHRLTQPKNPMRCARPHRHLVITWDGQVPICCAVAPHQAKSFGDVNSKHLLDIWNSNEMNEYRWRLQNAIREGECHGCVERMAYPHVVREVSDAFKPKG